jgi:hypothetical protein
MIQQAHSQVCRRLGEESLTRSSAISIADLLPEVKPFTVSAPIGVAKTGQFDYRSQVDHEASLCDQQIHSGF